MNLSKRKYIPFGNFSLIISLFNLLFLTLGIFVGIQGFLNVGLFMVWADVFSGLYFFLTDNKEFNKTIFQMCSHPIEPIINIFIIFILVWDGRWVTSIFFTLTCLFVMREMRT